MSGNSNAGYIFKKTFSSSMKLFKILLCVFTAVFLFSACQKEYSLETGNPGGLAKGSLQDTAGACLPITVRGQYFSDSTVSDSNFVLIQVRITTPGNYLIVSDQKNGLLFRDSGYLGTTGTHTIKLKGSGRPIRPETTDFAVNFDTTTCFFTVTVNQGTGGGGATPAVYNLVTGNAGECTSAAVQGTYQTNTPLGSSNTVSLQVNVTSTGSWSISTTAVNGMSFSGAGNFNNTGLQTISLQGSGTPVNTGGSTIPVTAGTSNCSFSISVAQGTGGGGGGTDPNDADSAWSFTGGTKFYHGPFDYVDTTVLSGVGTVLELIGSTSATGDTILYLGLLLPGNTIQAGTFNTNNGASTNAEYRFIDYRNATEVTVDSSVLGTTGSNVIIQILSYNSATRLITGTFSGTAKNKSGATVNIAGGKFAAKLE